MYLPHEAYSYLKHYHQHDECNTMSTTFFSFIYSNKKNFIPNSVYILRLKINLLLYRIKNTKLDVYLY